nr:MAG TPA: hypothetical protein [Caudoviricetes sp.]
MMKKLGLKPCLMLELVKLKILQDINWKLRNL